jgi:hypothetical protein
MPPVGIGAGRAGQAKWPAIVITGTTAGETKTNSSATAITGTTAADTNRPVIAVAADMGNVVWPAKVAAVRRAAPRAPHAARAAARLRKRVAVCRESASGNGARLSVQRLRGGPDPCSPLLNRRAQRQMECDYMLLNAVQSSSGVAIRYCASCNSRQLGWRCASREISIGSAMLAIPKSSTNSQSSRLSR